MKCTALWIVLIIFFFNLVSCDIFKTRTPAEPSQSSSSFEPLTEPELVIKNIVNSFQEGNVVNYTRSFSELSFEFEASTNARNKYGSELNNWDKTKEKKYFENIKSKLKKNSKVSVEFTQTEYGVPSDNCDVTTFYRLIVPHNVAGVTTDFRGQAKFQLSRDSKSGEWSINKWIDTDIGSIASDSTWSDLKGVFITQ